MSNREHTRGPWHYSGGAVYSRLDAEGYGRTEECVALRCGHERNTISPSERDANMRLCAAAPDMLAALQAVYEAMPAPATRKLTVAWDAMRAAIAKARGE